MSHHNGEDHPEKPTSGKKSFLDKFLRTVKEMFGHVKDTTDIIKNVEDITQAQNESTQQVCAE